LAWAFAIADAAFNAVRMLRRAILDSRDHFMMGQQSCRSNSSNKGMFCSAAKTLTRWSGMHGPSHRRVVNAVSAF
jgi:hypothetical protein